MVRHTHLPGALPGQQSNRIFHRPPAPTSPHVFFSYPIHNESLFILPAASLCEISKHEGKQKESYLPRKHHFRIQRAIARYSTPSHPFLSTQSRNGRHNTRAASGRPPNQHPFGQCQRYQWQDRPQVCGHFLNGAPPSDVTGQVGQRREVSWIWGDRDRDPGRC